MYRYITLIILTVATICVGKFSLFAQDHGIINRSETIQVVDGKEYYFHAVLQGQTLYSIARAYNVSQEMIIKENPELEQGLKYNQLIKIPVIKEDEKPAAVKEIEYIEHVVKRRETIFGISRKYNVSQQELLKHNPEARKGLQVNQVLKIPVKVKKTAATEDFSFYIVRPGDTPFGLSRKFNVPLDTLETHNPGFIEGISVGQRVAIPRYKYLQKAYDDTQLIRDSIFEFEPIVKPTKEAFDEEYCKNPKVKDKYNVALMIPLYLEELSEEELRAGRVNPNHPSFEFIQFYEGILIALESVKNAGVEIELHVFDVCDKPSKTLKAVNSINFAEIDLIIGPFFKESIEKVAYYAENNDIAIISPLYSNNEQLKIYENVFQATPSLQSQLSMLADFVADVFFEYNIILAHSGHHNIMPSIKAFENRLLNNVNKRQYELDSINLARIDPFFHSDTYVGERTSQFYLFDEHINIAFDSVVNDTIFPNYFGRRSIKEFSLKRDTLGALITKLDSTKNNIVIALVGGEVNTSNILRELHHYRDTFDITVVGTPQWRNLESIDFRYMNSLKVHLFAHDFIDYSCPDTQYFIHRFRKQFYTEPERYAYLGNMIGMYFFNALWQYGKEFYKCTGLLNDKNGFFNKFYFSQTVGENYGWENTNSAILRYINYSIIELGSK